MDIKKKVFRPLRRIKKTGKITVASYPQWSSIMTTDYNEFNLIINDEYKMLPKDEYVYDHNGELLFFFTYNPADVPVFQYSLLFDFDAMTEENKQYGILWDHDGRVNYNMRGTDCYGVPTFSHLTSSHASEYKDTNQFEPLTVGTVVMWFGWFLYQLKNSNLQIGNVKK